MLLTILLSEKLDVTLYFSPCSLISYTTQFSYNNNAISSHLLNAYHTPDTLPCTWHLSLTTTH